MDSTLFPNQQKAHESCFVGFLFDTIISSAKIDLHASNRLRVQSHKQTKNNGSTLYSRIARNVPCRTNFLPDYPPPRRLTLRILDPVCGNGALLEALCAALEKNGITQCDVTGVETDRDAAHLAGQRLARFQRYHREIICDDFLESFKFTCDQPELWPPTSQPLNLTQPFDVIIANPPYVRTQILGAARAQQLARRYGLKGRVDLYHAFVVAMIEALKPDGMMGIITSNRFLVTRGGASIRSLLLERCHVMEIIDLGDTKLFEAAVLPAIILARRRKEADKPRNIHSAAFTKIYFHPDESGKDRAAPKTRTSILDALNGHRQGRYRVPEGIVRLTRGRIALENGTSDIWSLTTAEESKWIRRILASSDGVFSDLAFVRVGIKTTADDVFIRSDWEALPPAVRPEASLLHPLFSHEDARRWSVRNDTPHPRKILYPHEVINGDKKVVNLSLYPHAKAYLESHRTRLEKRDYLMQAGRRWYEIWVPQNPSAWAKPKIVFPDINPEPCFYMDLQGHLIDGNCYWITLKPGIPQDVLYLLLGVANSKLMAHYHDLVFPNRLYAGRRRFITQYVARYPYPPLDSPTSRELIRLVKKIIGDFHNNGSPKVHELETNLNRLVNEMYGLRAYPSRLVARKVIQAQTRCNRPRQFSAFFSQRVRMRRKRFIPLWVRSTTHRLALKRSERLIINASSPRARMWAV